LAIFAGVLAGVLAYGRFGEFTKILLCTSALLTLLGAVDDRFDLSVRMRLLVQAGAILTVVFTTGIYVHTLGHIFGYELELGWIGIPVTVISVIGLLNAFNMMDGIDGLAGCLCLVCIGAIVLFDSHGGLESVALLTVPIAFAILPYLACNLGLLGRRIFMGDAGSMVLGYLLAWILINLSQGAKHSNLSPIDILWCVALPVLDTLAVMYRRIRQRKSPFKPDRGHIHHILLASGLGARGTLAVLIAFAASLAFLGALTHLLTNGSNLIAFCLVTAGYITVVNRAWHRQERRKNQHPILARSAANDDVIPSHLICSGPETGAIDS
jgi:UDP-GlcNAc:undecaprenyl-phosphate GlcNAc-1-phosphate transferase